MKNRAQGNSVEIRPQEPGNAPRANPRSLSASSGPSVVRPIVQSVGFERSENTHEAAVRSGDLQGQTLADGLGKLLES